MAVDVIIQQPPTTRHRLKPPTFMFGRAGVRVRREKHSKRLFAIGALHARSLR